jgi:hypothetical protein
MGEDLSLLVEGQRQQDGYQLVWVRRPGINNCWSTTDYHKVHIHVC